MKNILVLNYEFPPLGGGASPVSFEIAKRMSEQGFTHTWKVFYQEVASSKQASQRKLDLMFFAQQNLIERLGERFNVVLHFRRVCVTR